MIFDVSTYILHINSQKKVDTFQNFHEWKKNENKLLNGSSYFDSSKMFKLKITLFEKDTPIPTVVFCLVVCCPLVGDEGAGKMFS